MSPRLPKIRALDARPVMSGGRAYVAVRDPLRLTEQTLLVPQALSPVLALCDGTRDASAISAALAIRFGQRVPTADIEQMLSRLDEVCLLDNDRAAEAQARALEAFRSAPFRPLADVDRSYSADPKDLADSLEKYLAVSGDAGTIPVARGLVSPHIDFSRGGRVYGQVWSKAAESVCEAELAIILGTDHYGPDGTWTLTRQNYATPFGVVPTDQTLVSALAQAIGSEAAFDGELRHRGEHSIELALVWLHHVRGGRPCRIVPVLCGSFGAFYRGESDAATDVTIPRLVRAIRPCLEAGGTIIVAAADLSHVGPAFGGPPVDLLGRARLQAADDKLIDLMCAGDAEAFLDAVTRDQDRNNVCGVPPIYMALCCLSPTRGVMVSYDRCPADTQATSLVSICGVLFQ